MINPHELRLNNKVIHNGNIYNVLGIDTNGWLQLDNDQLNTMDDECYPIPLTEEWLKKIGFTYDDMSDTNDDNTWYHLDIGIVRFHSDKSCNFESVYCGINMTKLEFKHVHVFQNFIFGLTGKELQINTTPCNNAQP